MELGCDGVLMNTAIAAAKHNGLNLIARIDGGTHHFAIHGASRIFAV